ncbi:MAG: PAAR domain-containing protein [Bryobacteraceae bacterium]|nr:PAAR domain-containing protein [Bryobacteraceae bacterium]
MPPAARITDMHTCPLVTGTVPHVGGPILAAGCPAVLIGNLPAARVGDMALCVGPPDVIAQGSPTVVIGNMPVARIGDATAHGGVIVSGCPTVIIGEMGLGGAVSAQAGTMKAAKLAGAAFTKTNCDAVSLGAVNTEQLSTGGAFGSQAATMSAARQRGAPFTCTDCDKSGGK